MTTVRAVAPAALGTLLLLAACRGQRVESSDEPGVQAGPGFVQRPCPTPPAGFEDPRQASFEVVARFLRARARDRLPNARLQRDSTEVIARGKETGTRAWAVPALCADVGDPNGGREGRLLGFITANGAYPYYGLQANDTVYVWALGTLSRGMNSNGAVLVNLRRADSTRFRVVSLEYHREPAPWGQPYARFNLRPRRAAGRGAAAPSELFRLASFTATAAQAEADASDTSAWFSCPSGCCRTGGVQ